MQVLGLTLSTLLENAIAGLFAGVAAAGVLWFFRHIRDGRDRRKDEKAIRDLLRVRIGAVTKVGPKLQSKSAAHRPVDKDEVRRTRAYEYNVLLTELGLTLERWTPNLSLKQRKDIYDALDWYNLEGWYDARYRAPRRPQDLVAGKWEAEGMEEKQFKAKLRELESIDWLKLDVD